MRSCVATSKHLGGPKCNRVLLSLGIVVLCWPAIRQPCLPWAPTDADSLLKKLAITSLQKYCAMAILYTFAAHSREADPQHCRQEHNNCTLSTPSAPSASSPPLHYPPSLPVAQMPACVGVAQPDMHSSTPSVIQPARMSIMPVSPGLPCTAPSPVVPISSAPDPLPSPAMQSMGGPSSARPLHKRRRSTASHDPQSPLASTLLSHSAVHRRQRRKIDSNNTLPASTPPTHAPTLARNVNPMLPNYSQQSAARPSNEHLQTITSLSPPANNNAPMPAPPHFSSSPRRTFDPEG